MTTSKALAKLLSDLEKKYQDPGKAVEVFVKYVKHKDLIYKLPNVLKHLERNAGRAKDSFVDLAVAHEVTAETLKEIRKFIGVGEHIAVNKKIDSKLLGGFVAEHNNLVYDGSVGGQLKRLRETLLEN